MMLLTLKKQCVYFRINITGLKFTSTEYKSMSFYNREKCPVLLSMKNPQK